MKVKELKELIKNLDDEMVILTPYSDHSYRKVQVGVETVVLENRYHYSEYWEGQDEVYRKPFKVLKALIFG